MGGCAYIVAQMRHRYIKPLGVYYSWLEHFGGEFTNIPITLVSHTSTSAVVNRSVARHIVIETERFRRLLVIVTPCWDHLISNGARYSLGIFPFGDMLRLVHVTLFVFSVLFSLSSFSFSA